MTVKELRAALFEIENQNMTIKELRAILFNIQNESDIITPEYMKNIKED